MSALGELRKVQLRCILWYALTPVCSLGAWAINQLFVCGHLLHLSPAVSHLPLTVCMKLTVVKYNSITGIGRRVNIADKV